MKLLVLAVLTWTAVSAQLPSFGIAGAKMGETVGGTVGLGLGSVVDTIPKVLGGGMKPSPAPAPARGRSNERPIDNRRRRPYKRPRDEDDESEEDNRRY